MAYARSIAIVVTALALAGCFKTGSNGAGLVQPDLPPLPGHLAADCRDPGVRSGEPVLGEFIRNRVALADCRRTHRDTVGFYEDLRKGLRR